MSKGRSGERRKEERREEEERDEQNWERGEMWSVWERGTLRADNLTINEDLAGRD